MKTFKEFVSLCEDSTDKSKPLGFQATIRRQNPDGRISPDRRLTDPERRRANPYKPRKDIGTQRTSTDRLQQPTQERGSADVKAKADAAAKAERKAAAEKRAAAKSSGQDTPKVKPKSKDLAQQTSKLLSNKPAEVDLRPKDQPKRAVQRKYTRADEKKLTRDGLRKVRSLLIAAKSKRLGIPPEKVKLDKSFDIK
jgi:hypothetical protein